PNAAHHEFGASRRGRRSRLCQDPGAPHERARITIELRGSSVRVSVRCGGSSTRTRRGPNGRPTHLEESWSVVVYVAAKRLSRPSSTGTRFASEHTRGNDWLLATYRLEASRTPSALPSGSPWERNGK